ncbi:DUF4241 domain-containing protein [Streptomyces lavendulae]
MRIPPGVHRVEIAWTAGPYEFFGEQFHGVECAATRLRISDDPVVGWEMGLGVDDDIDRLPSGEKPRFAADHNVGCFADAGAWTTLSTPFRRCVDGRWEPRGSGPPADGCERISDESQQADLVTFGAESGGIVWLGRTASGDVAAVVVTRGLSGAQWASSGLRRGGSPWCGRVCAPIFRWGAQASIRSAG